MWSGMYRSPEASRFEAARRDAAGMPYPGERGNYTAEFFLADFPQFTRAVPGVDETGEEDPAVESKTEDIENEEAAESVQEMETAEVREKTASAEDAAAGREETQAPGEPGKAEPSSLVPEAMLGLFISQANDSVLPSRWGSMWRYAAGLYVAHFSAMYLKTWSDGSASAAGVAASAGQPGAVKQATMGDTSISYDNAAVTAGTEKWGAWNSTQYGQQLVTMARMAGMGGVYVI